MKKLLIRLLILISFLFNINTVQANHYAGGEISYVHIGGSSYKVTQVFYRDCRCCYLQQNKQVNFKCSSASSLNFNVILPLVSNVEITNDCPSIITSCSSPNNGVFGIQKLIYEAIVTLPPCSNWTIYSNTDNWRTITSMQFVGSSCNALILNDNGISNSSPIYLSDMAPIAFLNDYTIIDCGGVDPDGDSLSYSLFTPYTSFFSGFNSNMLYNAPYSYQQFISSSSPVTIDSLTGIISFTPNLIMSALYGVRIDEWRVINGVSTLIASSFRDLSIDVIDHPNNSLPVLSGIDTTMSHPFLLSDSIYEINKCYDGNPISFRVNGNDSDVYNVSNSGSPELFEIDWNDGINGATFTTFSNGSDSAFANFYWQPTINDISNSNLFTASIKDLACGFNGIKTYVYELNLFDSIVSVGNDTTICFGEELVIHSSTKNNQYSWTFDGNLLSSSSTDYVVIQPSFLSVGTHTLKVDASSANCSQSQQIIITVIDLPNIENISDTSFCQGQSVTYNAGVATSYLWTNFLGDTVENSQYFTPTVSGEYNLLVKNQSCESSGTFNVNIIAGSESFNLGNDTTITDNVSITLMMPYGYSSYLWSDGSTNSTLNVNNSFDWMNTIVGTILDPDGCNSSDTIVVYIGYVGITSSNTSDIKVYPNPIDDVINISFENEANNAKLKLYDVNGKLVRSVEFSSKEYVLRGLNDLSSGNYFLKIILENKEFEYSIIKK